MRKIILTSILFLASCSTEASLLNLNKSKLEVNPTTSEITVQDFKSHIGYLASDDFKGRAPGTIGDEMAKDYIVNFFNPFANFSNSKCGTTPPVGFAGEFNIINLVLSFIKDSNSSASNEKLFSIL